MGILCAILTKETRIENANTRSGQHQPCNSLQCKPACSAPHFFLLLPITTQEIGFQKSSRLKQSTLQTHSRAVMAVVLPDGERKDEIRSCRLTEQGEL